MFLSKKQKFFKNTAVVSFFTMISRVFGYIRDAVIFIFISNANGALDAFFVAFRIPNFFRRIFGEGALSTAYVFLYLVTIKVQIILMMSKNLLMLQSHIFQ